MSLLLSQLGGGTDIVGSGTLVSQASTVAGVGITLSSGSGTLTSGSVTVSGVGLSLSIGTGALAAQPSTVIGTGTVVSDAIVGIGVLTSQNSTASGAGLSFSIGTGTLTVSASSVSGIGITSSSGTGTLTTQASITATGTVAWVAKDGIYLLEDGTSYLTEDGDFLYLEEVRLVSNSSTVSGIAFIPEVATGALISGSSIVVGTGLRIVPLILNLRGPTHHPTPRYARHSYRRIR